MTDRTILLSILALLVGFLVAGIDYLARNTTDTARLLFDFSMTFALLWLGYTIGKSDG